MNYYSVEAIWKSSISTISPVTSVKFEGIRAESVEAAKSAVYAMIPVAYWLISKVREQ